MHAGFPHYTTNLIHVLQIGAGTDDVLKAFLSRTGGTLVAGTMALLLKLGFGFVMREGLLDQKQSDKAKAYFEDNFVIVDPEAPDGKRYYQGKFLIRTRKAEDDMNVFFSFCPSPEKLFIKMPWGKCLNPLEVVHTKVLTEDEADALEQAQGEIDLVIRFRDTESILGLIGGTGLDIVDLLLDNVVQPQGNVGHLFKLGAIGANIQQALPALAP